MKEPINFKPTTEDVAHIQHKRLTLLGFVIAKLDGMMVHWHRRIGDVTKGPFNCSPVIELRYRYDDKPQFDEIAARIINKTVEAQQARSRRAMKIITGV